MNQKDAHIKNKEIEEKTAKIFTEAAKKEARLATFTAQKAQIDEAVSAARAKGICTEGTVMGLDEMLIGITEGKGVAVADIGIENNIEANELDPNRDFPKRTRREEEMDLEL